MLGVTRALSAADVFYLSNKQASVLLNIVHMLYPARGDSRTFLQQWDWMIQTVSDEAAKKNTRVRGFHFDTGGLSMSRISHDMLTALRDATQPIRHHVTFEYMPEGIEQYPVLLGLADISAIKRNTAQHFAQFANAGLLNL